MIGRQEEWLGLHPRSCWEWKRKRRRMKGRSWNEIKRFNRRERRKETLQVSLTWTHGSSPCPRDKRHRKSFFGLWTLGTKIPIENREGGQKKRGERGKKREGERGKKGGRGEKRERERKRKREWQERREREWMKKWTDYLSNKAFKMTVKDPESIPLGLTLPVMNPILPLESQVARSIKRTRQIFITNLASSHIVDDPPR